LLQVDNVDNDDDDGNVDENSGEVAAAATPPRRDILDDTMCPILIISTEISHSCRGSTSEVWIGVQEWIGADKGSAGSFT
jgi:hypothetical protein